MSKHVREPAARGRAATSSGQADPGRSTRKPGRSTRRSGRSTRRSVLLTALLLVAGTAFLHARRGELAVLAGIEPYDLIVITVLTFAFFALTGTTFALLLRLVSIRLSPLEIVGLSLVTNFGNYLGPTRPGAALKAMYLKGEKRLPYSRFAAVLAANAFVLLFVSGVTGLCLLALLRRETGSFPPHLAATCLVLIGAAALPFLLPIPTSRHRLGRWWRLINEAADGFREIRAQKLRLLLVCASVLAQYVLSAVMYQAIYRALQQDISFTTALVLGVFTSIANLVTLTPNNVGVQEVVTAYLYSVAGLDFTTGLIGAGLLRAVHLGLTFGCTPIFAYFLFHRMGWSLASLLPGRLPPDVPTDSTEAPSGTNSRP